MTSSPLSDLRTYKVGSLTQWGQTVAHIYRATRDRIVFRNPDGRTQWETSSDSFNAVEVAAHQCHDAIADYVHSALPRTRWPEYEASLAQSLFTALSETHLADVPTHFDGVRRRLADESVERGRYAYLTGSLAAALGLGVALSLLAEYPLLPNVPLLLRVAVAGAVGAFTSVLVRAGRIRLKPMQSPLQFAAQGAARILLGAIFAGIVVVATKADLILGFAVDKPWALAVFGFAAAFGERYIPEIVVELPLDAPESPVSTDLDDVPRESSAL